MKVREICRSDVVTVSPLASLRGIVSADDVRRVLDVPAHEGSDGRTGRVAT